MVAQLAVCCGRVASTRALSYAVGAAVNGAGLADAAFRQNRAAIAAL
jgi:hypothetical protein